MNKQLVLTTSFAFSGQNFGGGHVIVLELSHALCELGADVTICSPRSDHGGMAIDGRGARRFEPSRLFQMRLFWHLASSSLKGREQYVVCLNHELLTAAILSLLRPNVNVYFYAAAPSFAKCSSLWRVRRNLSLVLCRIALWRVKKVFCISSTTASELEVNWGVARDRLVVARPGVAAVFWRKLGAIPSYASAPKLFRILTVGRIYFAQKPVNLVLSSVARYRQFIESWTVIGDGSDMRPFETLVREYGVSDIVKIVGAKTPSEVAEYISESHFALLPTVSESMFMVAYECAAAGLPLITNDVASVCSDLGGDSGGCIIVAEATEPAYEVAMSEMISTWRQRKAAAVNRAPSIRSNFAWLSTARVILERL